MYCYNLQILNLQFCLQTFFYFLLSLIELISSITYPFNISNSIINTLTLLFLIFLVFCHKKSHFSISINIRSFPAPNSQINSNPVIA